MMIHVIGCKSGVRHAERVEKQTRARLSYQSTKSMINNKKENQDHEINLETLSEVLGGFRSRYRRPIQMRNRPMRIIHKATGAISGSTKMWCHLCW